MSLNNEGKFNREKNSYNKDKVFDRFDMTNLVNDDLLIPKTKLEYFFYKKEATSLLENMYSKNNLNSVNNGKTIDEIIKKINNNNFGINIDEIIITFPNDYKISFIELYTPIDLIGQGGFGIVISVIEKSSSKKMAVKIIQKSTYSEEFYLIEAELLQKLNHDKILKFHNVINTVDYLFIFTDLCEGGSLKDLIISRYKSDNDYFFKDSECSIIIKHILQGIEYLSQNNIIHRDLKPENIMFKTKNDLNSLVICDLGIAGELKNVYSFTDSKCGTLTFMAPEIIMDRQYDKIVDIWSIGIILYILESGGEHPLLNTSKSKFEFIEDIKSKKDFKFPTHFPPVARNLFLKMCKYEPCFRYDVIRALNHPWITRKNSPIPLTVLENIHKEEKINNFKEMIFSIIFISHLKKELNFHMNKSESGSERNISRRKLNIRKGMNYNLFPMALNSFSTIVKKQKTDSKGDLPILTKPNSSKKISKSIKKSRTLKLTQSSIEKRKFNRNKSRQNINLNDITQMEKIKYDKLKHRKSFYSKFNINNNVCYELKTSKKMCEDFEENYSQQLKKTPIIFKKKSLFNIDICKCLTATINKNKENICLNNINQNLINEYSNIKTTKKIYPKMYKAGLVEPKNLFGFNKISAIKYVCFDLFTKKKN